jgi:hypothetical protein
MPTDKPTDADVELSRQLASRGVKRSPRTCLRWRRAGVLIPPSDYDEDDKPIYSEASIERALAYAWFLDDLGHDEAVIVLWGNEIGRPGIPKTTILNALRNFHEKQLARFENLQKRLDPDVRKPLRLRRDRQLTAEEEKTNPKMISTVTKTARRRVSDDEEILAVRSTFTKETRSSIVKPSTPPLSEVRADLAVDVADVIIEGDVTEASVIADAFDLPPEYAARIERQVAPLSDYLKVIDACKSNDDLFDRLIGIRDALRPDILRIAPDVAVKVPALATLMALSNPAAVGRLVATVALAALTFELHQAEAAEGATKPSHEDVAL